MDVTRVLTVAAAVLFTAGCSGAKTPEPPPPAKTVFDPLTQNLDRARRVQQEVDANAEGTRQAVDHQERGDSSQ
jgi:hypothetical protein